MLADLVFPISNPQIAPLAGEGLVQRIGAEHMSPPRSHSPRRACRQRLHIHVRFQPAASAADDDIRFSITQTTLRC